MNISDDNVEFRNFSNYPSVAVPFRKDSYRITDESFDSVWSKSGRVKGSVELIESAQSQNQQIIISGPTHHENYKNG